MKKINYENACKALNYDSEKILPDVSNCPEEHRESMIADFKLIIIIEAINMRDNDGKKWMPDYTDGSSKYEPIFTMGSSSGVGFAYYYYGHWLTRTYSGSRLCYKNYDSMIDAVNDKEILALYKGRYTR